MSAAKFQWSIPAALAASPAAFIVCRQSDDTYWDFAPSGGTAQTFVASPGTGKSPAAPTQPNAALDPDKWLASVATTGLTTQWSDGFYVASIVDAAGNIIAVTDPTYLASGVAPSLPPQGTVTLDSGSLASIVSGVVAGVAALLVHLKAMLYGPIAKQVDGSLIVLDADDQATRRLHVSETTSPDGRSVVLDPP